MNNSLLVDRIDSLIRFFLYILIFWLPYSPAVIESCIIICIILWLLKRGIIFVKQRGSANLSEKKSYILLESFKPKSTFLNKPITFFLLVCLLSVAGSVLFAQSLHNFFTKTLEWFIVYFLIVEVFKNKKHIYIALAIFVFTAFSTVIDSLVQFYITYKDIFLGYVIDPGSRATAGFKTANGLGGYLIGIIPILSAWILFGKQRHIYRLLAALVLFFMIWSLVVTFSRGAWIGALFGGIFLLLIVLFPQKRRKFYLSLGLLGMTISLSILFILILAGGADQELFSRYQTITWRVNTWIYGIEMIKDRFFFGHGINTFMRVFQAYRGNLLMGPTYAHNCYIQLAAETGMVGLLCFFWIILTIFHRSLREIKLNFERDRNLAALAVGLLAGIFAFLTHSFFDTNFYSLQLSVYLWFMVGVLVSICKIFQHSDSLSKHH